jgi:hypothetical protein
VDLSERLNPVVAYTVIVRPPVVDVATLHCGRTGWIAALCDEDSIVPKLSAGKLFGILFGVIVVAVMIFMMFAVISGLIHRDQ